MKSQYLDPVTGEWIDADDIDVIPDGGRVRVALQFMDAAPGNPLQDARDAAYDAFVHRLDPHTPCKSDHDNPRRTRLPAAQDAADKAYAEYCRDLSAGTYHGRATA